MTLNALWYGDSITDPWVTVSGLPIGIWPDTVCSILSYNRLGYGTSVSDATRASIFGEPLFSTFGNSAVDQVNTRLYPYLATTDVLFLELGTNDLLNSTNVGATHPVDPITFAAAWNTLCGGIAVQAHQPSQKYMVGISQIGANGYPWTNFSGSTFPDWSSSKIDATNQWRTTMMTAAGKWGYTYIDLYPIPGSLLVPDGLHPTYDQGKRYYEVATIQVITGNNSISTGFTPDPPFCCGGV